MKMTILAPAKLNLFLDITGKRNDGYHIVNMVMQAVSLFDEVTVTLSSGGSGFSVECSDGSVPCGETNTAYRAAKDFFEHIGRPLPEVGIRIKKRIPSQAGMAGGSTDAAAVLFALNSMTDSELPLEELCDIAEGIGADVPFCLYGGTMTAGGIGTILSPLPDIPDCCFVIVKPDFSISTAEAYRKSDELSDLTCVSADRVVSGVCNGDIAEIGRGMYNRFEEVAGIAEIDEVKSVMMSCGAKGAILTGSGSAIFGLFDSKEEAEICEGTLSEKYDKVYIARPVSHGVTEK